MLEKPNIADTKLIDCLVSAYGISVRGIEFLPLGADFNTAVYRVVSDDDRRYFLKLRRVFDPVTVLVPQFLHQQGIAHIIPSLPTTTAITQWWVRVEDFTLILYPYIEGMNGFERPLSCEHWRELGQTLQQIHQLELPSTLVRQIPQESYSPFWRDKVRVFLALVQNTTFDEPVAAQLAAFLRAKASKIEDMIVRAEKAVALLENSLSQEKPRAFVLCHTDIHVGNMHICTDDEALYIVDWDAPIFAPKERDLMFIGAGIGASLRPETVNHAADDEACFYQGYRHFEGINALILSYYRYERIIQDIGEYCDQLLLTDEGGSDREASLQLFMSQFEPNNVVEIAYNTDENNTF